MVNDAAEQTCKQKHSQRDIYATDIGRPIHQFSTRCEHSLQICSNDHTKPIVPACKYNMTQYLDNDLLI